jgi:uncharacterized LabA/DUF88 family protein
LNKIAIFVDVQNVYYTCRETYKRNFDYNQFWAQATENCEVKYAFAYAIARSDEKQKQFQNILRAIGFEVKLKPFIQRADGSAKGDWDVGITLDIMDYASEVDKVILVSGDGDFAMLLDRVQGKFNVPCDVYGVAKLTASALINSARDYIPIEGDLLL